MAEEKKKLTKSQRRSVNHLFVEQVSIPLLILATSVLFTTLSLNKEIYSLLNYSTIMLAVIAIPLLGMSIFARRAVAILSPKS